MKKIFLALILIVMGIAGASAQKSCGFYCDTYDRNGNMTHSNIPGEFALDYDEYHRPVLIVTVKNPAKKHGAMPFGFFTDPDYVSKSSYNKVHPYDDSLHDVYYIYCDEEEFMIAVKYVNGSPSKIIMSEKFRDKAPIFIHIPYSKTTFDRIYGVLDYAKRKINFQPM